MERYQTGLPDTEYPSSPAHLSVVSIGVGFSEDGWDGGVTANLQIIFGALILLKEIVKVAC